MSDSDSSSTQNNFNISGSSITNVAGSGSIHYYEANQKAETQNSPTVNQVSAAKTILFLAANPQSTPQLRLDQEMREIEAGLQRAKWRDQFVLQQRWAVRVRDFERALLDLKPQIIHFSGHGAGEKGLVLEDETGTAKLIDTAALEQLFGLFSKGLECVILNACYSEIQAEAIARHIPYVIGMNEAIYDIAAIEFAIGFYDALGAGESVEFAYKLGCFNIRRTGISEDLIPVLKQKPSS